MKQHLAAHPGNPGSSGLAAPPRDRRDTALDKALAALRELLAVTELADELAAELCHQARRRAGIPEARHAGAKLRGRQALLDIETLTGEGR